MSARRRIDGFSLLELAIVVAVFGVLATVLLDRLAYYEELAEKIKMEATISTLKSALRERMATMMIEGRVQEYASMAHQNPFDWLEKKPENYRGEISRLAATDIAGGSWYFDSAEKALAYVVKNGAHFQADSQGRKQVRLQVVYLFNRPVDAADPEQMQSVDTVALRVVQPYRWF